MLEGRGADLTKKKKKKKWVLWSQDLMGGSLFPLPYGTQEGNGVATERGEAVPGPMGPTCGAAGDSGFWAVRACVGVCARVLRPRVWGPCVCVRCARVCPACVRAWRRRARDPAAVVRARRSARPSAGAQHRLRPRVCMRGVSERVGGPSGVGCGAPRRGRRRSQDALAPGPAPPPPAPRQSGSWGRPAPPPQQLAAARGATGGEEGASGGACRRPGQAPRPPSGVRAAGGGRGRAGPQGGRPAALEEPREQKETATAPAWSKQPALAAAQGRAAAWKPVTVTPSPPPPPPSCASQETERGQRARERARGRLRDATQACRGPRRPLIPSTSRLLPAPPPFPPGFRVDLPTHCYVRLGGAGD